MCEFCSIGPDSRQHGGDQTDLRFSGFFSPEAIEAAVRQSSVSNGVSSAARGGSDVDEDDDADGEEDDDGT